MVKLTHYRNYLQSTVTVLCRLHKELIRLNKRFYGVMNITSNFDSDNRVRFSVKPLLLIFIIEKPLCGLGN
jgi:hypothetical protein